ncbi:hypothetical protein CFC21_005811, partial [Triticum aestivum]
CGWRERVLGERRMREIQRFTRNAKLTVVCLMLTILVLRGTVGAGKFGTPQQDLTELRHRLHLPPAARALRAPRRPLQGLRRPGPSHPGRGEGRRPPTTSRSRSPGRSGTRPTRSAPRSPTGTSSGPPGTAAIRRPRPSSTTSSRGSCSSRGPPPSPARTPSATTTSSSPSRTRSTTAASTASRSSTTWRCSTPSSPASGPSSRSSARSSSRTRRSSSSGGWTPTPCSRTWPSSCRGSATAPTTSSCTAGTRWSTTTRTGLASTPAASCCATANGRSITSTPGRPWGPRALFVLRLVRCSPSTSRTGRSLKPTISRPWCISSLPQREKWGNKVYLENGYYLHGYWGILVDRYEEMLENYQPGLGDHRWPLVTHFVGCKPCSKFGDYPVERCLKQMDRAFNFGDNQVLHMYGFEHKSLCEQEDQEVRNETSDPLDMKDDYGLLHPAFKAL